MSKCKKRVYCSESRKSQASQTRNRILAAARCLFHSVGYESVTIDKIAQASEVSTPTIYSLFHSKLGVLRALMDEVLPSDRYQVLIEQAWAETSSKKIFKILAQIARELYAAETAEMTVFRGISLLAPEFKDLETEKERRRYLRFEVFAEVMEKTLPKGLNLAMAKDILWAFTGRDMHRLFVVEQGWTPEQFEQWLAQMLINMLVSEEFV